MNLRRLCVFCSSSDDLPDPFRAETRALGTRMAAEGIGLVYGGGSVGLMGGLADAVLSAGGIVTRSMHERKREMSRLADAFAILPGGFGTLEEFFEILTWKQLGLHSRPIIVANTGGWFDPLHEHCLRACELGALTRRDIALFSIVNSAPEVVDALLRSRVPPAAPGRLTRT